MLLSGESFPISYNTFVSQFQTIAGQSAPYENVNRALTRLKSAFVSLDKEYAKPDGTYSTGARFTTSFGRKSWCDFYSPTSENNKGGTLTIDPTDEFEFQVQVGSKMFPEMSIRSHAEAYYQLRTKLGLQSSKMHSFDISPIEYRDNKLILGIDAKRVLEAGYTGIKTRSGDLLTVKPKQLATDTTKFADRIHIV